MPAARGVKRSASKSSASTASAAPKNKKKRGVIQLEIPTALKKRGSVYTCGQGDVGQLGLGEDLIETTKFKHVGSLPDKMVDICAGGMHTIAVDSDGKVWTWGCNDEGALGRPTSADTDEGLPAKVSLPRPAVALSAGDSHSAALLADGDVFAWGSFRDSHGSMGLVVRGREGKPCREPVRLPLSEPAVAIASGGDHLVVLTISGSVYTMGCGEQGQLGRLAQRSASRESRQGFSALLVPSKVILKGGASRIWAGYHATFVLDSAGERMLAFGLNNYGQLGVSGEKRKTALYSPSECDAFPGGDWRRVSAGQHHTLALDGGGRVYAVGRCEYGRLGLGDRPGDAETLEPVPKLADKKCVSIAAGTSSSFAVTDAGEVYAWGMGSEGQLGTGNTSDAAEPTLAILSLEPRRPVHVAAGGQHTVLLAEDPTAQKEPSPAPEQETEEEKVEEVAEEKEVEKEKKRPTKRQKKQEQDEEISSTSSAQPSEVTTDKPEKVNGDEKKEETQMEVDEPDKTQDSKDDKQTENEQPKESEPAEESEKESKDDMDTSSQGTVDSDVKEKADADGEAEADADADMTDAQAELNGTDAVEPKAVATIADAPLATTA